MFVIFSFTKKYTFEAANHVFMNLEAVNKMRVLSGLEPLTELPKEGGADNGEGGNNGGEGGDGGEGDNTETPEQIEAKRKLAEEAGKDKKDEDKKDDHEPGELSDEELLGLLGKRGITVASLEDLKKKEEPADPALVAEQREVAQLAFGLSKGLFNKKEYDQFVAESQNVQELVFADYYDDAKKADPELKDDEIREEFLAKYGLDKDPDTRMYKRGVKEIAAAGQALLKAKHAKIFTAQQTFSAHEADSLSVTEKQNKVTAGLPGYKKAVEEIFTEFKKIPFKFSDEESYEVDILDDVLNGLKTSALDNAYYTQKILQGYDKDKLKKEMWAGLIVANFPTIAQEIAKQHLVRHKANTRGVPLGGGEEKKTEAGELTEAQKVMVEMHRKDKAAATATS